MRILYVLVHAGVVDRSAMLEVMKQLVVQTLPAFNVIICIVIVYEVRCDGKECCANGGLIKDGIIILLILAQYLRK
ncbi:MAG: hypothetical protein QS748_10850 [Candidatus Endonucleobacter bathymodioli]|uniref:Uncharacterized protein n=1 Tax=Candidatus Endonucleibacter bathymodioli TaxID=539814 RepID=A0AA90STN0_9GAMM|nr:hypothetical protein [Candidatus Endonucleobacter bathymodioli]